MDVGLNCNEVEAVASLHNVPDAWLSSPYAHDSRPEQGKTEVGADPAQCGWIGLSSLLWQEWSQSLAECGCQVPHFAWSGEDQGCKWAILHFNDALLIFSFLGIFLAPEAWLEKWPSVGLRVWLKTLTSKNAHWRFPPQNPLAWMSALALSSWLAEAKSRDSPSRGWRSGSRVTSGQTSARSFPVKFVTLLCQRMGKAPLGQFRAWLMEKALPHSHLVGNFSGIHLYLRH